MNKPKLIHLHLSGSPRDMGRQFGEACRAETRELYAIRIEWARTFAKARSGRDLDVKQVLTTAESCLATTQDFHPDGYAELVGIGEAAGLTPAQMYVLNGLTDLRDVLAFGPLPDGFGCTSFMVGAEKSATGNVLIGQTWDLLTDNMPFMRVVHRTPDVGPKTVSLTLTGCLTLAGMNEHGIAVGTTNLVTTDSRPGLQYLSILHRGIQATDFNEACDVFRHAHRASGHYYYVGSADQQAMGLECSAEVVSEFPLTAPTFAHCNHALSPEVARHEFESKTPSTSFRQTRMDELLSNHAGPISVEDIKTFLADHEGDECSICRHDYNDISTNGCIIMSPATRELHACYAHAHTGEWVSVVID